MHPKNFIETKVKIGPQGIEEQTAKTRDIREKYQSTDEVTSSRTEIAIDRDRLNKIVRECSKRGAVFGKDVQLNQEDINEIGKVIDASNALLEKAKQQNKADWDKFMDIMKKLDEEGSSILISQRIFNGGHSAKVVLSSLNSKIRGISPSRVLR